MGLADTAELVVKLTLAGNFSKQLKATERALGSFDARLSKTEGRAFRAGQQIGTGIKNVGKIAAVGIAALGTQVVAGLGQLAELESQTAQTNAVIKSTGGIAGITAKEVRELAEQYENVNAVMDDKVIQSGENLLLTFTAIRKEAFEPTLEAALDMSTALDQDLNVSVLQLGKALSDPIKGITALRRAGVVFSADQQKLIKTLVEEGDLLGAQKVILEEVGKEFGGSFAAQGKTAEGAIAGIGDAVEDLQKALATALFPTIQKVLPRIREALTSPEFIKNVEVLGEKIAGLFSDENIASGVELLKGFFNTARTVAPAIAAAAEVTGRIVSTAVNLFKSLPPELQSLAVGAFAVNKLTGGLVTNIAGGLISSVLKQLVAGVMHVNAGTVVVSGAAGAGGVAPVGGGAGRAAGLVNGAMKVFMVGAAAGIFAELLSGRLEQAGANQAQAAGTLEQAKVYVEGANIEDLKKNLAGLRERQAYLTNNLTPEAIAYQLDIDGVKTTTERVIATLQSQITTLEARNAAKVDAVKDAVHNSTSQTVAAAARNQAAAFAIRDKVGAGTGIVQAAINNTKSAIDATRAAAAHAGQQTAAAIRDKDLSVTVNNRVTVPVTIREFNKTFNTYKSVYKVAS